MGPAQPSPPHCPQTSLQSEDGGVGTGTGVGAGDGGAWVGAAVGLGVGAIVGGGVGASVGCEVPATLKSTQEMKVSGGEPDAQVSRTSPTAKLSERSKVCVGLPMLLKSLQVFPVFQTHLPTATLVGHEKEAGMW